MVHPSASLLPHNGINLILIEYGLLNITIEIVADMSTHLDQPTRGISPLAFCDDTSQIGVITALVVLKNQLLAPIPVLGPRAGWVWVWPFWVGGRAFWLLLEANPSHSSNKNVSHPYPSYLYSKPRNSSYVPRNVSRNGFIVRSLLFETFVPCFDLFFPAETLP